MDRKAIGLAMGLAALIAAPAQLAAQACAGSHATHGQGEFGAEVAFTDGAVGYGLSGRGFTRGPLFVAGGYSRVDYDNTDVDGNELGATLGAELATSSPLSLCPAASFGYSWFAGLPEGTGLDGISLGGGLGVGRTMGDELLFTPYGSAAVVYTRATFSFAGESNSDSDTYGQFAAGFSLGSTRFYGGPSVSITTLEGSDPVFGLSAFAVF